MERTSTFCSLTPFSVLSLLAKVQTKYVLWSVSVLLLICLSHQLKAQSVGSLNHGLAFTSSNIILPKQIPSVSKPVKVTINTGAHPVQTGGQMTVTVNWEKLENGATYDLAYVITGANAQPAASVTLTANAPGTGTFQTPVMQNAGKSTIKIISIHFRSSKKTLQYKIGKKTWTTELAVGPRTVKIPDCSTLFFAVNNIHATNIGVTASDVTTGLSNSNVILSSPDLITGTYTVKYDLNAGRSYTGLTSTMSYVSGTPGVGYITLPSPLLIANGTLTVRSIENCTTGAFSDFAVAPPTCNFTVTAGAASPLNIVSASKTCPGGNATVSVTGTITPGNYTITYNLDGANSATGLTSPMTFTAGRGILTVNASDIPQSGNTTISITSYVLASGGAANAVSPAAQGVITVTTAPQASNLTARLNLDLGTLTISSTTLATGDYTVNYNLAGTATVSGLQSLMNFKAGQGIVTIPDAQLSAAGTAPTATITSIVDNNNTCSASGLSVQSTTAVSQNAQTLQQSFLNSIPTFAITGLGTTQLTSTITPNLNAQLNVHPTDDKRFTILVNFNFGTSYDSVNIDSLNLLRVFYPSQSSFGFTGSLQYDILPLLLAKGNRKYSMDNVAFATNQSDYTYFSITPTINYSYRKISLNGISTGDSLLPQIETQNLFVGLFFGGNWSLNSNLLNISINPFMEFQWISKATQPTYQHIFRTTNHGFELPTQFNTGGIEILAQVGKMQLSFTYNYPLAKASQIKDPTLLGGYALLKATVIGDFLNLNFLHKSHRNFGTSDN